MKTNDQLIGLLRDPSMASSIAAGDWTGIVSLARRELVLGHLAAQLQAAGALSALPERLQAMLEDGLRDALYSHRLARSEANFAADALHDLGCRIVVMKGSAYVLAGIPVAAGRFAGDLDLMVPRSYLGAAEIELKQAGWRLMAVDAYDDHYYRTWMHELPPMQHGERKTMLDMHHTILPLTGRVRPDATALMRDAVPIPGTGLYRFCDADMVLHSAAHWIQDGDLLGGLRNLHDIHRLITAFAVTPGFWETLATHARQHDLARSLYYALTSATRLFGTAVPADFWVALPSAKPNPAYARLMQWMIDTRLRQRPAVHGSLNFNTVQTLLLARSHFLRMPPVMLARHLARKQLLRWQKPSKG